MGWVPRFFALALNDKTTLLPLHSPKIPLEQQIQQRFREIRVIVDMFVEFEMAFNHIFPLFVRHKRTSE
jgi:hypothetical protein